MRLTIRRVGGQLPTLRPTSVVDERDLDNKTCEIARTFVRETPRREAATQPDVFLYVFELEEDGRITSTSVSFSDVPESLRPMLPSPSKRI
jgi:hypothetical protein